MKCPFCNFRDTKVIDSRPTDDSETIRRRRECLKCSRRFTTYERYEDSSLIVIKKDNTREAYDKGKVLKGMVKSCEKRPVSLDTLEKAVSEIEVELNHLGQKEVTSAYIGELIMEKLKTIDQVAYVRFASVYREFTDVSSFIDELENLKEE